MKFWRKIEDVLSLPEAAAFLVLGHNAIMLPIHLIFPRRPTAWQLCVDLMFSVVFAWESYHRNGKPHTSRPTLLSKFAGVLAIIPWFSVAVAMGFRHFNYIACLQVMRFAVAPYLIQSVVAHNQDKLFPKRFKFIAAGYITAIILNAFACGWLLIYPPTEDPVTAYVKAMYWLVTTIATVGYGDITPTTNTGRFYAMFMMITGAAIWGILIASASRLMLASDRRKEQRKEKMEALQSFFSHYEIPKKLQGQVIGFYNHLLSRRISDDERAVLNELPTALQGELQIYMNLRPISRVSLFRGVSFACLADASKKLNQVFFAPGEQIIRKGDVGKEMYLIGHGSVTVHSGDQFIANLDAGHCFGEFALIGEGLRTADVTADTYCDIFTLSKTDFDEFIKTHEDLRRNIEKISADRKKKSDATAPLPKAS